MLTDLQIKNFAIIDALQVSFGSGLTILTGETGAGKSIIIDAVNLILGGRASTDLIRTGAEEASVEAIFDLSLHPELLARLAEMGIDCDGELLVKRVVNRSGKNRVFVGGGLSTLAALADLSRELVNIYGQHESQTLLRPENHLRLLDGFGGLLPQRNDFANRHARYREILAAIRHLEEGEREAAHRIDLLSFQATEIAGANLAPGEDAELERERTILANGEKLLLASGGAYQTIYGGDGALLGSLRRTLTSVREIAAIDPALETTAAALDSAYLQLEDAALGLRDYSARIEADPERLRQVEDRLDLLNRLKRKYAPDLEGIIDYRVETERELELLRNRDRTRDDLDRERAELEDLLRTMGAELTAGRRAAAERLQEAMERELRDLAMGNARLQVAFEEYDAPRPTGWERAEFLFSPNPGEEPKPLAKIASGGELSRLMLALKQVHPESDVPTLIFDEVDTGIGGATAALVGRKLHRTAREQQVLCITHHPQVAAYADRHYRVAKEVTNGRTATAVACLDGEERVAEIARMLGGVTVTETTRQHAREMIAENTAGKSL